MAGGLTLQAAGSAWIALIARPGLTYPALIAPMMLAGIGVSMAMPAAQNAVMGAVRPPRSARRPGTFNMLRQLGGAFGIAILAAVFAAAGSYASPHAFSIGFTRAVGVAALLSLGAAVAGLFLPGRRGSAAAVPPGASQPAEPASRGSCRQRARTKRHDPAARGGRPGRPRRDRRSTLRRQQGPPAGRAA